MTAIRLDENESLDSEKRNPAIFLLQTPIPADNPLNFAWHSRKNAKEKTQILYQYLSPVVWNDSKNDTIPGYRFAIALSFCNGCIGVQKSVLGCKSGSVGATPSFRFAICCFAHICPVSGIRTEWGRFLDHSHSRIATFHPVMMRIGIVLFSI